MRVDQKISIMCHFLETRKYRRLRQRLLVAISNVYDRT